MSSDPKFNEFIKSNKDIVGAGSASIVFFIFLFIASFVMGSTNVQFVMNLLWVIFGCTLGWLIGLIISPYNKDEQSEFSTYSKAFVAAVSGYMVSKFDKVIEHYVDHLVQDNFAFDDVARFRITGAFISFVATMLLTHAGRRYWRKIGEKENKPTDNPPPADADKQQPIK